MPNPYLPYTIYKIEQDLYVIAVGHTWLPGVYETKEAAEYARFVSDDVIDALAKSEEKITLQMLQNSRPTPAAPDSANAEPVS